MVSVIIPSYKDPLLFKTIESLRENCEGDIEIIVVFDGYVPEREPDTKCIYLPEHRGMREAINTGVRESSGSYIMRTDEHCMFGRGYDSILSHYLEDNWIVTPRRYKLDIEKWQPYGHPVDHEKLGIYTCLLGGRRGAKKFHAVNWPERSKFRKDVMIDEKTAMQGSCWLMTRNRWDKVIGRLESEGYGTLYQDSIEMLFKNWQAGGKLMVNKNTWYAHKARKFKRTHHYPRKLSNRSFEYAVGKWEGYFREHIEPKIKAWEKSQS